MGRRDSAPSAGAELSAALTTRSTSSRLQGHPTVLQGDQCWVDRGQLKNMEVSYERVEISKSNQSETERQLFLDDDISQKGRAV